MTQAEYALSNPRNKANKIIKLSTAGIELRKYKSISKEQYMIQLINEENCNDCMTIYIVSILRIQKQKHNISPEFRICDVYEMKKI
jgi:hypothetical protein